MSGVYESYVSVRQSTYETMMQQAGRADSYEARSRMMEEERLQRERRVQHLEYTIQEQNRREARFQEHMGRLSQDLRTMEMANQERFKRQRKEFEEAVDKTAKVQRAYTDGRIQSVEREMSRMEKQLASDINRVNHRVDTLARSTREEFDAQRQEYRELLRIQDKALREVIREQGEQLQKSIQQLEASILNRFQKERDIASEWLNLLKGQLDLIRDNYRHELFAPGELRELMNRYDLAGGNLGQDMAQAALAACQEGYLEGRKLQERLELMELEWDQYYVLAQEAVESLRVLSREHRCIPLRMDEAGGEVQLDVDYWTEGKWSENDRRITALKEMLEQKKDMIETDLLRSILEQSDQIHGEILAAATLAKAAMVSSIQRRDLQEQIFEKLSDLGYSLTDSTYEGEDFRKGYHLKMVNGNGEEIITVMTPSAEGNRLANQLSVNFYDHSPNEAIRRERVEGLMQELGRAGMDASSPKCIPEYERGNAPESRRDFETLRRKTQGGMSSATGTS